MNFSSFYLNNPGLALITLFFTLIALGTFFLLLPWSHTSSLSLIDALFTATSAVTLTGLTVNNIGEDFTLFGQLIILILIQIGAIGIMVGAAFIFLLFKKSLSLSYQVSLQNELEEELGKIVSTIKFIILSTFLIEVFGSIALWLVGFKSEGFSFFFTLFHAVSGFANAGFSLSPNSLEPYRANLAVNIIFAFLIIAGSIGYPVLKELKDNLILFAKKERISFSLHTKVVLLVTCLLIIIPTSLFLIFEKGNLKFNSFGEFVLTSFFHSISSRTAGFYTVPFSELSSPTLVLIMILMFIGGAPASVAGGVKLTTITLAVLGVKAIFSGKERIIIFKREVASELILRALATIFVLLSGLLFFILLLLSVENNHSVKDLIFEAVSAFGTVGYSTGITPSLNQSAKIILVALMLFGRIAPLTLAILGVKKMIEIKVRYPQEKIILG